LICTLLSVFAIYSLVSLTCGQRRKEIAIRKVNGANVKDILNYNPQIHPFAFSKRNVQISGDFLKTKRPIIMKK